MTSAKPTGCWRSDPAKQLRKATGGGPDDAWHRFAVFAVFCSESSAIDRAFSAETIRRGRFGQRENSQAADRMPLFFAVFMKSSKNREDGTTSWNSFRNMTLGEVCTSVILSQASRTVNF
jgi:hypothetical protein